MIHIRSWARGARRLGMTVALTLGSASAWCAPAPVEVRLDVSAEAAGPRIEPEVYGQFVEHLGRGVYDGLWVGPDSPIPNVRGWRLDLVQALRRIAVPVIRWPGGCFADDYDWRDGIGDPARRPLRLNHWWGGVETNRVGTHEFMDLAQQLGAQVYLAVSSIRAGHQCRIGDSKLQMRYVHEPDPLAVMTVAEC